MSDEQHPLPPREQPLATDLEREPLAPPGIARNVLIAGSSGLIGSNLCKELENRGWDVWKLVRRDPRTAKEIHWNPVKRKVALEEIEGFHAVFNFCGAGIGERRWTKARKELLSSSRIDTTAFLAFSLVGLNQPPSILINASAVGYYGHNADGKELAEGSHSGGDFLASLTRQWEAAAVKAMMGGTRVILPRLGMVLANKGGALAKLLPLFAKGLGGIIGNGKQWVSWISLTDAIRALIWLLEHPDISGPVNLVSPNPVTNREFTDAIASCLGKPALLPAPAFAVKAALGEMGETLAVKGVKAVPERLLSYGFEYKHLTIAEALEHELH